jgi:hypothetical protein
MPSHNGPFAAYLMPQTWNGDTITNNLIAHVSQGQLWYKKANRSEFNFDSASAALSF